MSEAKINVSTGFSGGVSVSLRADSADELLALQAELRKAAASDAALASVVAPLVGQGQTIEQATAVVQQAFPQAAPVSTVGQPLPAQPAPWTPQPVAQPTAATPPGLVNPGPCAHGERVYKDSMARGSQWRRWECAIPWSKGATGRCKPVDA